MQCARIQWLSHEVANVGAAGFAQIFEKPLFERHGAARDMRGNPHAELPGQRIAAGDQLFRAHAGGDPMRIGFDSHRYAHAAVRRVVPAPVLLFVGGKRLVEAERMARVAGRAAAQLLAEDMAQPDRVDWFDRRAHDLRRGRGHGMVERGGGAGRQHFHGGDGACDAHRLFVHVERQRQQQATHPVFQQHAIAHALEQGVPVMLMHVDQAGRDDAALGIDHFIEAGRRWRLVRRACLREAPVRDGDEAARIDVPLRIHRDDMAVSDQRAGRSCAPDRHAVILTSSILTEIPRMTPELG